MPDQTRKLAAIMFTDIAGYTESMSYDEHTAIQAVKKKRSIIQPLIKDNNGVFVKEIGDGTLSYFSSAIDASTCAVKLQETTYDEDQLNLRVGLHIGDIVFDGEDVFGEGVNIASRLESLSPIGGVCVSKNVFDELENKKEFNGESLGLQSLKGVGRLVEVYALKGDKLKAPDKSRYKETKVEKHTDDEVPSIAIIPFTNKGADEDVFFAYGISADLITECSGAGLIRVASLSDVEKLDYTNLDNNGLSEKLFVRYIAQGMLWKMGNMFQLSMELYDTKEKKVIWSDRWQENWDNLPNIKSNLSDGLLKALDTKPKAEKKTESVNPEAYEFYLKGKHTFDKRQKPADNEIAIGLLNKAIKLDDNLIAAKILIGNIYRVLGHYERAMDIFRTILTQAEHLNDKSGMGDIYNCIGAIYFHYGDFDKALEYSNKSIAIAEEIGDKRQKGVSLSNNGVLYHNAGKYDDGLSYYKQSLEIVEEIGDKVGIIIVLNNIGLVYTLMERYDEAQDYLEKSLELQKANEMKWLELETVAYLYYSYKKLGKDYKNDKLQKLILNAENIEFELGFQLYKLLGDVSYLKSVYEQLQKKSAALEDNMKEKYLSYPLPRQLLEAWEKVNS